MAAGSGERTRSFDSIAHLGITGRAAADVTYAIHTRADDGICA